VDVLTPIRNEPLARIAPLSKAALQKRDRIET
jgi:hypothetical protein